MADHCIEPSPYQYAAYKFHGIVILKRIAVTTITNSFVTLQLFLSPSSHNRTDTRGPPRSTCTYRYTRTRRARTLLEIILTHATI
jgi:hypothetical protein